LIDTDIAVIMDVEATNDLYICPDGKECKRYRRAQTKMKRPSIRRANQAVMAKL